jgi:coproporphyrinogen III oxidase-like Fe-S oxidoreductase
VDKQAYFDRMGRWPQDLFAPTLERLRGLDLVEEDQDFLRLTARGRFFADEVVMQFFEPRFVPPRKLA